MPSRHMQEGAISAIAVQTVLRDSESDPSLYRWLFGDPDHREKWPASRAWKVARS